MEHGTWNMEIEILTEVVIMPPVNKKGGKNNKKKKGGGNAVKTRRLEDIAKDFDPKTFEVYGQVDKVLGNRRFEVKVQKLTVPSEMAGTIICSIKGSFRQRIVRDMPVLVKLYEFNAMQGQIIDGYNSDELSALKSAGMWDYPLSIQTQISVQETPYPASESDSESDSEPDTVPKLKPKPRSGLDSDLDLESAPTPSQSRPVETDDDIDAI